MADDQPRYFTNELAKNSAKGASFETVSWFSGLGIGAIIAASQKLKGWNFVGRVSDLGVIGLVIGLAGRLWKQDSANHESAMKLDSKMLHLEHENKVLKDAVVQLGAQLPEYSDDHAEKLKSARTEGCGCNLKH